MPFVSEQTHLSFSLSYKDTMSFMKIEGQYFEMFWNIVVGFMKFSIFEPVVPSVNSLSFQNCFL